jgi:Flp pilus assembly pilin Flp
MRTQRPHHQSLTSLAATEKERTVKKLVRFMGRLAREVAGQDMVEYALLFALISIVALGALMLAGPAIKNLWEVLAEKIATSYP